VGARRGINNCHCRHLPYLVVLYCGEMLPDATLPPPSSLPRHISCISEICYYIPYMYLLVISFVFSLITGLCHYILDVHTNHISCTVLQRDVARYDPPPQISFITGTCPCVFYTLTFFQRYSTNATTPLHISFITRICHCILYTPSLFFYIAGRFYKCYHRLPISPSLLGYATVFVIHLHHSALLQEECYTRPYPLHDWT
jgi:hypothetical protein